MTASVTRHGERRVRKRIGLPKKTVQRLAERALVEGNPHTAFKGGFRGYLEGNLGNADNLRVFHGFLFLFAGEHLITCWALPHCFKDEKPLPSQLDLDIRAEIAALALPIEYAPEILNEQPSSPL